MKKISPFALYAANCGNEPKAVKGKRPFLVDAIDEMVLSAIFTVGTGAAFGPHKGFMRPPKRCV